MSAAVLPPRIQLSALPTGQDSSPSPRQCRWQASSATTTSSFRNTESSGQEAWLPWPLLPRAAQQSPPEGAVPRGWAIPKEARGEETTAAGARRLWPQLRSRARRPSFYRLSKGLAEQGALSSSSQSPPPHTAPFPATAEPCLQLFPFTCKFSGFFPSESLILSKALSWLSNRTVILHFTPG